MKYYAWKHGAVSITITAEELREDPRKRLERRLEQDRESMRKSTEWAKATIDEALGRIKEG
jgi:hypothetical protein